MVGKCHSIWHNLSHLFNNKRYHDSVMFGHDLFDTLVANLFRCIETRLDYRIWNIPDKLDRRFLHCWYDKWSNRNSLSPNQVYSDEVWPKHCRLSHTIYDNDLPSNLQHNSIVFSYESLHSSNTWTPIHHLTQHVRGHGGYKPIWYCVAHTKHRPPKMVGRISRNQCSAMGWLHTNRLHATAKDIIPTIHIDILMVPFPIINTSTNLLSNANMVINWTHCFVYNIVLWCCGRYNMELDTIFNGKSIRAWRIRWGPNRARDRAIRSIIRRRKLRTGGSKLRNIKQMTYNIFEYINEVTILTSKIWIFVYDIYHYYFI